MGKDTERKIIDEVEALPSQLELNFDDPEMEIDFRDVEHLCHIQATTIEIRAKLNCSEQTLERECQRQFKKSFLDYHTEKRALGRLMIRQTQFEMLRGQPQRYKQDGKIIDGKGDWRVVQWLSINFLGQSALPEKINDKNESSLLADAVDNMILEVNKKEEPDDITIGDK